MRRVKSDKPEQSLSLQSANGFEDRVFEAKVKAGQTRGQLAKAKAKTITIEFCSRAVLEFEASPRGHHSCPRRLGPQDPWQAGYAHVVRLR